MTQPGRGSLIAFRNDRLGARLISLVNAMRIGLAYDVPVQVHWPEARDVGEVFNDPTEIFDSSFVAERFIPREEWRERRKRAKRASEMVHGGPNLLRKLIDASQDVTVDQAFGINVLRGEDEAAVRRDFVATLGKIPFAMALKAPMAELETALEGATAYHIRRGDLTDGLNAKNKPWPHKMVPNEFYELHMERALGDGAGGAVLFSDDEPTLTHYCQQFPGLRTIRDLVDIDSLTEAQRDFIELYAMSRAAKIIAPERSAFSSTAVDLGQAVKRSVMEDMTDEMSGMAYERLFNRLQTRPDSFSGDGEIGQSLAHIGPWLARGSRWQEAAALFGDHVARGLNIAFVYPDTMHYQHRAGDIEGVLNTGRHMQSRRVYHVRYFVEAEALHGYGHIRAGNRELGLRHIVNGFWHGPTSGVSRSLVPALVGNGELNAGNFLPVSAFQLRLHSRRGPVKQLMLEYPELFATPDAGLPSTVGSIETAVWDFAPLLRGASITVASRDGTVAQVRSLVEQTTVYGDETAEKASLLAVLDAYEGNTDQAIEALTRLAQYHPDHAMTWQRLSHALFMGRQFREASGAAEEAAVRAGSTPMIQAWYGQLLLRTRAHEKALEVLALADRAETGFPVIPMLLSQARAAGGDLDGALSALDRALALAPMEVDFVMQRARLLDELGRQPEAADALEQMVALYKAPGKLFRELVELLTRMDEHERADAMVRACHERFPDHPITRRMLEERAA